MTKPSQEELIANEVRYEEKEGKQYFCVADIRMKFPEMKFDTKRFKVSKKLGNLVPYEAIEPMTDFDKNIQKLYFKK